MATRYELISKAMDRGDIPEMVRLALTPPDFPEPTSWNGPPDRAEDLRHSWTPEELAEEKRQDEEADERAKSATSGIERP